MNLPLDRGRGAAAGVALLVVLALAAFAVSSRSPQWTLVFAGGLLLAAGFLVMAPCQLQMSATLTVVLRNLAAKKAEASGSGTVRRSAAHFALGYVLFYLPVAVVLGGLAWALGRYAWVLTVLGGLMAASQVGTALLAAALLWGPEIYAYYGPLDTLWGLSREADQRLAGLVMIVVDMLVALTLAGWIVLGALGREAGHRSRRLSPAVE